MANHIRAAGMPMAAKILGAALCLSLVAFVAFRLLSPEAAIQRAERILAMIASGDAKSVYPLLPKEELDLYGLTPEEFEAFCAHYFKPGHEGAYEIVRPADFADTKSTVVRHLWFRDRNRRGYPVMVSVVVGENGPIAIGQVIRPMVLSTWSAKYGKASDPHPGVAMVRAAVTEGRDLERYGITGLDEANNGRLMGWPEVEARFRKRLEMKGIPSPE
ncbi:MAG: hypothetical protein AB7T05_03910 [Fimbriimonadaceae bacterium]